LLSRHVIPTAIGYGLRLDKGQVLRIIDLEGEQVADLILFVAANVRERFASGYTIDFAGSLQVSTGDVLYSSQCRPLLTIVRDDVARHDLILSPCSLEIFQKMHGVSGYHPNCVDNLAEAVAPFGISPDGLGDTMNVFMNVRIDGDGKVTVEPPPSRAGDSIDFRAEVDLVVGITACASEQTNNGRLKPVCVEIYESSDA
jgi:uncharacterized protein YcgI (DUF1989 family)